MPGRGGHAPAEDLVAALHGADLGRALRPAEFFSAGLIALAEALAGEGADGAEAFVLLGVIFEAQVKRVEVELDGELVHGGLEREKAGDDAGAAHGRGRADVHGDEGLVGGEVFAAIEHGGDAGALLDVGVDEGGGLQDVVLDGEELAVGRGAEAHALLRERAMADRGEHEAARDDNLDGTVDALCGHGGEQGVGPGEELAAEAGAAKGREDLDLVEGDAEHFREHVLMVDDALRGFVEGDFVAVPFGDGGVHLHGVVGFDGEDVGLVDFDGRAFEGLIGVAAGVVDAGRALGGRGGGDRDDVGVLFVVNFEFRGGVLCLLEGICNDDCYILAVVVDLIVFERRADFSGAAALLELTGGAEELVGVAVVNDGEDAGHALGDGGVDAGDARVADCARRRGHRRQCCRRSGRRRSGPRR